MTTIFERIDGLKKEFKGSFNDIKMQLEKCGGKFQESRNFENGLDMFINGRKAGILYFNA